MRFYKFRKSLFNRNARRALFFGNMVEKWQKLLGLKSVNSCNAQCLIPSFKSIFTNFQDYMAMEEYSS